MALAKNLGGLKHFVDSVSTYERLLNNFRSAMEQICIEAKEFAESQYALHGHSSIKVSYNNSGRKATIYANGDAVAFFEFGTGEVGEGTYNGALPQSGVPITSKWDYYYLPSEHKDVKGDSLGWWWGHAFITGREAESEMWETSQFIRRESHRIMKKYFEAGIKK